MSVKESQSLDSADNLMIISFLKRTAHKIHSEGKLLHHIWSSGPEDRWS
jgi:hypothetical protein